MSVTSHALDDSFIGRHCGPAADFNGGEFFDVGNDIFVDEVMIENIYKVYCELLAKHITSPSLALAMAGYGPAIRRGFYIPTVRRTVLSGQVDLQNDGVPEYSGYAWFDGRDDPDLVVVQKAKFPRGVIKPCPGTEIWISRLSSRENGHSTERLDVRHYHGVIKENGHAFPAVYKDGYDKFLGTGGRAVMLMGGVVAINIEGDRKHLWNVNTGELIYDNPTPIAVGVEEERVKSLFYARSLPLTPAGRKRPIMHWVEAHQRRLKAGIDIDITKHLRGIDKFEMGGFAFTITNPVKPVPRRVKA